MFSGEYQRTIDNKGRLFIPTKLRDNLLPGIAILSKSLDMQCLQLFSRESWEVFARGITKENDLKLSRWFFSSVHEENIDQQGRIKIQKSLIDFAFLKKDVMLIGVHDWAEIWAKEIWEDYYKEAEEGFQKKKPVIKGHIYNDAGS